MPRTLSPTLERMLRRANPHVAEIVEVSLPDQRNVLHRADDQLLASPPLVSMTPGASAAASGAGALTLASADQLLINQYVDNGAFNIPQEDGGDRYINTVAWRIDPAFGGCVLTSVTVRVQFSVFALLLGVNLKLQIFRAAQVAGVLQRQSGTSIVETALTQVSFAQLLAEPVLVSTKTLQANGAIDGAHFADVTFDLTPYRLQIDPVDLTPPGPGETGDLPELYFSVQTDQASAGNYISWRYDTTSALDIAGVGRVREVSWNRSNPDDPASVWLATESGRALTFKLNVEQYVPTSQLVYAVALDALPDPLSTGRVAFNRGTPAGTTATLELSTAGTGGPWTTVANGDVVALAQLLYHLRLTLTASADQRRAPAVSALGIEFRHYVDVSPESTVEPMSNEVSLPFLAASVGEGRVSIVRTGRRDYRDPGTEIAIAGPDTQLEVDVYLGSRHPAVTRDDWLHVSRASMSNRLPTSVAEALSLLSITKTLKRKIPAPVESINRVHTVSSATTAQVTLVEALTGASASGNEYDGKNYYIRVRKSAVVGLEPGAVFSIAGNTGTNALDFVQLPAVFAAGDELEVHSGFYVQPGLSWNGADLADIWWELLTVHLGVSPDRIGRSVGTTGRAGLPPRVTDRAPGDSVTQALLLVDFKTSDAESGDELVDQVSFLMGGTTTEIGGQIVFRQIYPLRDTNGAITVAPDPISAVFDARDYADLDTPTGREQRITVLSANYGVDSTGAAPGAPNTATFVDVDALTALGTQDVEGLGFSTLPDNIARWCYNRTDGGLFLASQAAQQVLFAGSTGLRAWPFSLPEPRPELTIGDSVVVVTDQYTDYDPARKRAIRGWAAYPLTIVSATADGRRFRGFLQGLAEVAAVTLRGGPGSVGDTDPLSERANLHDVRPVDGETTTTVFFRSGSAVDRVWANYAIVAMPEVEADWDPVIAGVIPLGAGATSYTIPRPADRQVALIWLEARLSDLAAGTAVRVKVVGTAQPPIVEPDDVEGPTTGTQFIKITERGIPVIRVRARTQIGISPISEWVTPSRAAGAASAVRPTINSGILQSGEWEQDTSLDPNRSAYIDFEILLANGEIVPAGPYQFDWDKRPNLVQVVPNGSLVTVQGDSDTRSVGLYSKTRAWKVERDGVFAVIDVAAGGTDGSVGLAPGASDTFTAKALSDPVIEISGSTLVDARDVNVGNGATPPAAGVGTLIGLAPSAAGSSDVTIRLQSSAAPAGWTARITVIDDDVAMGDVSASLTPTALTAPPTTLTDYHYTALNPRSTVTHNARFVSIEITAELRDNLGAIQATQTVTVSYYTPAP